MKRITECKSGLSLVIVLLSFMSQLDAQEVLSLEDCRRLAIENNKKVSFEYFDFNSKHERVYRRNGKRYFVNPLATIYDDDNYPDPT